MKLPGLKRLFKRDFDPQYAQVVDALADIVNSNLEVIFEALNKKVTFNDNISSTIKEVQVITDASGNILSNVSFTIPTDALIAGVVVIKVTNQTNSVGYPESGVFASYVQLGKVITIVNITGLPSNSTLLVKVMTIN